MISFRTASGRRIDLANVQPEDLDIFDIATGLSHCCRFAGQVPTFYSVAQHSCLVASLVEEEFKFAALMHDASEAYLGDVSRSLKHSEYLKGYRILEQELDDVIKLRFGAGTCDIGRFHIKRADDLAAIFEHVIYRENRVWGAMDDIDRMCAEGFVSRPSDEFYPLLTRLPAGTTAFAWQPTDARQEFLRQFATFSQRR